MQTDYAKTGKLYKTLEAYTLGNCSQEMPDVTAWYYFGSSIQFKTCKSFKAFLEEKYPNKKFKVQIEG